MFVVILHRIWECAIHYLPYNPKIGTCLQGQKERAAFFHAVKTDHI